MIYNFYANLKAKSKEHLREHSLVNTLGEMLVAMYNAKLTNTEINPKHFLEKLLTCGVLGVIKENNLLYFGTVTFSEVNPNDTIGKNATVIVDELGSFYFEDWRNNENVAIVRLNPLCEPDLNIFRYGYMLSQIDNSMLCNVVNTRLTNIFKARDSKTKDKLVEMINASRRGEPSVIVDELLALDEMGDGIEALELNQSDKINNIQYLSVTRSYIMNTFYSLYGMYAVGGEKIAQQSVEEINQGTNASWILPKSRLLQIREDFAEVNRKFGCDWTIDFSECWKLEDESDHETAENKGEETADNNKESEGIEDDNSQRDSSTDDSADA